jgi:hypothetical protein
MIEGMKAIELVKRVTALGRMARRGRGQGGDLARGGFVRLIRVTTVVARHMQSLPLPPVGHTERAALELASDQLRSMASQALVVDASDPSSPEAALSELVDETLKLVDRILARDPQLASDEKRALPAMSTPEDTPDRIAHVTKVRF